MHAPDLPCSLHPNSNCGKAICGSCGRFKFKDEQCGWCNSAPDPGRLPKTSVKLWPVSAARDGEIPFRNSLKKAQAHYINLIIRSEGVDYFAEGDWLKKTAPSEHEQMTRAVSLLQEVENVLRPIAASGRLPEGGEQIGNWISVEYLLAKVQRFIGEQERTKE